MTLEKIISEVKKIIHDGNVNDIELVSDWTSVFLTSDDFNSFTAAAERSIELGKALDSQIEAEQKWRYEVDEARGIAAKLEAENKMLRDAMSFLSEYFDKLDGEKPNYIGTFELFMWASDLRKARDVLEKLK